MKIKDIVNLKGCYSAHDVGELEVKLTLDKNKILEILDYETMDIGLSCEHCGMERQRMVNAAQALKSKSDELIIKGE